MLQISLTEVVENPVTATTADDDSEDSGSSERNGVPSVAVRVIILTIVGTILIVLCLHIRRQKTIRNLM